MEKPKKEKPLGVGIGTIVLNKDGKILMGKRGDCKLYGLPGGHLERYESWEECSSRELKEETNLDIPPDQMKFVAMFNVIEKSKQFHYIDIIMLCRHDETQEVKNLEPHACAGWEWWSLEDFETRKSELFYPLQVMIGNKEEINLERLNKLLA